MATAREESGEGSVFGHNVSAYLMARLASRLPYADFSSAKIVELVLQGSFLQVPFDDQVVTVQDGYITRRHLLQCKIQLKAQPSNETFQETIGKAYKALFDKSQHVHSTDIFVIVCQECANAKDFGRMLEFAAGSKSLDELKQKLGTEGSKVQGALNAIVATLKYCIRTPLFSEIDELSDGLIHELLRRLRIWQCDLSREGSQDRINGIRDLIPYCGFKVERAEQIYQKYSEKSSVNEARRSTFTWDSLRGQYGIINKITSPHSVFTPLANERIDRLEAEIDLAIIEMRTVRTFESYKKIRQIVEDQHDLTLDALRNDVYDTHRFIDVVGKATRAVAMSLIKLNASKEVLQKWLPYCQELSVRCSSLNYAICRIALEIEDQVLLDSYLSALDDEAEMQLISGLKLANQGDYAGARERLELVQGEYRVDALINLANLVTVTDPNEDGHATSVRLLQLASELHPERVVLRLLLANHLQAQYLPHISSIYVTPGVNSHRMPADILHCINELDEVTNDESLGVYEHMFTSIIRMQLVGLLPSVPAILPVRVTEALEVVSIQSPDSRRRFGALLANIGERAIAIDVLENISVGGDADDDPSETARLLRVLNGDPAIIDVIPKVDNTSLMGMVMIRDGYYATLENQPSSSKFFFEQADSSQVECSFVHEIRFIQAYSTKEFESCAHEITELFEKFPYAIATWNRLQAWLSGSKKAQLSLHIDEELDREQINLRGHIMRQNAHILPIDRNYSIWMSSVWNLSKRRPVALGEIEESAKASGNAWAFLLANALSLFDRMDFREAARQFDRVALLGELSPDMRLLHDQSKWLDKRFEDLASSVEDLLSKKHRHPGQASASIFSLRELKRDALAVEVAKRNFQDFPDDEDAEWLYIDTCLKAGRKEEGFRAMESFTNRFPESKHVSAVHIEESEGGLLSIIEDIQKTQEEWHRQYTSCNMPLKLLPGSTVTSYLKQSELLSGLQTCRAGFGLLVASLKDRNRSLMVDYTACITLSRFDIWAVVIESGVRVSIPEFVYLQICADSRLAEFDQVPEDEATFDRVNAFLKGINVKVARFPIGSDGCPVLGLTYLEGDLFLSKHHDLTIVDDTSDGGALTLHQVVRLAKDAGKLSQTNYQDLHDHFGIYTDADSAETETTVLPERILLCGHSVERLASLSKTDIFLNLFSEVWVGPTSMLSLGSQFSSVEVERSGRRLLSRLSLELTERISNETITVVPTDLGRSEDINYFKEMAKVALSSESDVWVDDMATRRLFMGEQPPIATVSTLECLALLCQEDRLDERYLMSVLAELAANGHRDVLVPDFVRCICGSAVGDSQAQVFIRRLAWQFEEGHLSVEEKLNYMKYVVANVLSALEVSLSKFLEIIEVACDMMPVNNYQVISAVLSHLLLNGSVQSVQAAVSMGKLTRKRGWFSMRGWCLKFTVPSVVGEWSHLNFSGFPEEVEFEYWCKRTVSFLEKEKARRSEDPRTV